MYGLQDLAVEKVNQVVILFPQANSQIFSPPNHQPICPSDGVVVACRGYRAEVKELRAYASGPTTRSVGTLPERSSN
jgi:hypothetical protein